MWTFDKDLKKWNSKEDSLNKDSFDTYKQEFSSFRFYSKCLSGATYLPINNLDNIYDVISRYIPRNWYVSIQGSPYSNTSIPIQSPSPITIDNSKDYYEKYISEYGLTLKNKFTPERLIKDSIKNFLTVDVSTLETIDIFNPPEIIDVIRLVDGHRVLVKNQTTSVVLSNSTNPNTFFEGNFRVVENFGSTTEYDFFNSENGIYLFTNNQLIKQSELDVYDNSIRYSVSVKLGDFNRDRQFHLSRLKTGYYPEPGQPFEFIENKNWLLRNQVDYNNIFDLDLYDVLKHGTQSYTFEDFEYSIPERVIVVGEFGSIINSQSGVSNIINNKFKVNLLSITETSFYYWIVGDRGTLLRVRKHDFDITNIEVDCQCPTNFVVSDLKSVDFLNDLNGVVVGDLNTILITSDGGLNWERIKIDAFDSYYFNKVIYNKPNRFFIAGNNGIFIDFRRDLSGWTAYRRRISRFEDNQDDYLLVDNINDMVYLETSNWNLDYTFSTQSTAPNKELIILATNDSKLIIHDINNSIPFDTQFFYLKIDNNYGDIVNISNKLGTNQLFFTYTGDQNSTGGIFNIDLGLFDKVGIDDPISNVIISSTQSILAQLSSSLFTNSLFDYNGQELVISGNSSLFKISDYTQPLNFNDLDINFESRFKSKMLFLDYDIASKLNFFTDGGDYRLPESVTFTFSNNDILFESITVGTNSEVNWFNYWQDRQMTFEYYNDEGITENKKVLMSSSFSYSSISTTQSIVGSIGLTNSLSAIINLAPGIGDDITSRFYGTHSLTAPNDNYILYLYDYLMVYKVDSGYPVDKGDVIRLESDLIDYNFIVNKIVEIGSDKYIYMFTEFNRNIITDLVNHTIEITNLNKFTTINEFITNFHKHPISIGYSLESDNDAIKVVAKFNNLTSYYNMSINIKVAGDDHNMLYLDSFLNFGYTPTYNILDYLKKINSGIFTPDKEYLAMPHYREMPVVLVNQFAENLSRDLIFVDNRKSVINNKILFGEDLYFEWLSLFDNTFVDVKVNNSIESNKLLINKKYRIENYDGSGFNFYVIEFHKPINLNNTPQSIDIRSRRTLKEISDDLQELNNIQRPLNEKSYKNENYGQSNVSFESYEKLLNFKVNTDSYAKILLSDLETLELITALIYIDDKNELSMNITRVDNEKETPILNTARFNVNGSDRLLIICSEPHDLTDGDGVVLEFTGGTGSSQDLNPQYFGFRTVSVINNNNFYVDIEYGSAPQVGNDIGVVKFIKKDPFLNYQPVDIINIGIDKRGTTAVELGPNNTDLEGSIVSLVDIDFDKFRFRLIDGLNIETLATNYGWMYEAEISDAVIGLTDNQITWYRGTWECGRWFGGRWISGTWVSGDWYDGSWESKLIKDNWINVEVDDKSSNLTSSSWFGGRWFGGTWNNGTWVNGRWYSGDWNNGRWFGGIWNDGNWNGGRFTAGIWVLGNWNGGSFSTENGPAYWLDGNWNAGDFENGMWYAGNFDQKVGESRFGIKSYNSRTSTWHGGNFIAGSFHSRLNIDNSGKYSVSNIHKYSIWRTGNWFSGDWYGGIAFNIDFKSGIWYGGILEDIQVIGIDSDDNSITLRGIFKFNTGDQISIIDNRRGGQYTVIGDNDNQGRYTVLYYMEVGEDTKVYVDRNINIDTPGNLETGLRVVSRFRNCNWKSGVWNNGIYERGLWEGGIWYDGIFNATWM